MGLTITGGIYKGRKLLTPKDARTIRPTSGKVRQALFNSLGDRIAGSSFVDLYAGSGAVGLEALSRGAANVTFVESDFGALGFMKSNVTALAENRPAEIGECRVIRSDVKAFVREETQRGGGYEVVFVDPPFRLDFNPILEMVSDLVLPGGSVVIQFPSRSIPSWIGLADAVKKYGESSLAFLHNLPVRSNVDSAVRIKDSERGSGSQP